MKSFRPADPRSRAPAQQSQLPLPDTGARADTLSMRARDASWQSEHSALLELLMRFCFFSRRASRRCASFAGVVSAQTVNLPPTISGTPPSVIKVNTSYNFLPTARDPEGRALKFSIVNKPGWMAARAEQRSPDGLPEVARHLQQHHPARHRRRERRVAAALLAITADTPRARVANRAPTISGTPATTARVGTAYSFQPSANDADGNALGFTIANRPSWATLQHLDGSPERHADGHRHLQQHPDPRERRSCDHFAAGLLDHRVTNSGEPRRRSSAARRLARSTRAALIASVRPRAIRMATR